MVSGSELATLRSVQTYLLTCGVIAARAQAAEALLTGCWHWRALGACRAPLSVAFLELISPECWCDGAERRPGCCMLQRKLPLCCSAKVREKTGPRAHLSCCWLLSCLNVTPDQTGSVNEIRLLGSIGCGSRGRVAKSIFSLSCNRVLVRMWAVVSEMLRRRWPSPPHANPHLWTLDLCCSEIQGEEASGVLVLGEIFKASTCSNRQLEVRVEIWRGPGGSLPPLGGMNMKGDKAQTYYWR